MKKFIAFCTLGLSSLPVFASSPVSVYTSPGPNGILYVEVQSDVNRITIQNVVVNRGNCDVSSTGQMRVYPSTLGYGDVEKYRTYASSCHIREVQVITDQGSYIFNMQ